ncbi:helix-turn-helix domain-containing protein [Vogesella oryzae]|uniref:helix-turn-helix domain-containing protein n=1 Tax=Vogesella oryzae TaxID=1735285 RepID=UPI0015834A33|nr:helix-turn-helix domain-containing protein [Vogesella oryzae]
MISQPPASTLSFVTRVAQDAADQAAFISGWAQDYVQLSAGRFSGRLDELCCGPVQVFREYSARETFQQCQPWPGAVWFGIPAPHSGERLRFHGHSVPAAAVLVSDGCSDFILRTPDDFSIYGIVIGLPLLAARCEQLLGHALPASWRSNNALALDAGRHLQLCQMVDMLLASARLAPDDIAAPQWQHAIVDALLLALHHSQPGAPAQRASTALRQWQWVTAASRQAISPQLPLCSIEALCRELHVTRRTLQNGFQAVTAMSPLPFLRALRLNQVRRELRQPERSQDSIQDIASDWGFWSPSQFSYEYRRLFGESPSQTRRSVGRH